MKKEYEIKAMENRAALLESRGVHNSNIVNKIRRQIRLEKSKMQKEN